MKNKLRETVLYQRIEDALYNVIKDREEYYWDHPAPAVEEIPSIIALASNRAATISGAIGLVPGVWGMLSTIPETIMLISNQMRMVYDIGMAHGKKDVLTPQLIMYILGSSVGASMIGMVSLQSARVLARQATITYLRKLIQQFGIKLTNSMMKSAISKWIPIAGAVMMSQWSRITTKRIGTTAQQVFELYSSKSMLFLEEEE